MGPGSERHGGKGEWQRWWDAGTTALCDSWLTFMQVTILPVWRELHRLAASAERDYFLNNNAKHSLVARLVPCSERLWHLRNGFLEGIGYTHAIAMWKIWRLAHVDP